MGACRIELIPYLFRTFARHALESGLHSPVITGLEPRKDAEVALDAYSLECRFESDRGYS